jgi:methylmalonyl-CoA/ethylmalonyl-CoA epimerase
MRFHHTGLIVESIDRFESKLVYEDKILEVLDPMQNAKLALYKNFGDSFIELIEPLSPKAFTWNFLKSTSYTPYHHFCYEVSNDDELKNIQSKFKLIPIIGPIPAKLFNDELVSFFYTRNKMIIEFLINKK